MASRINQATLPRAYRVVKKSFSAHRLWNLLKIESSRIISNFSDKTYVWGLPPVIMVEAASVCNLRCPCCACGSGQIQRKQSFLDVSLFHELIDELKNSIWMVLFWNQGEPFMNAHLMDMIQYASERGIYTITSTNGHFLGKPDAIINSRLDELIVSLDGASENTYLKYRIGGDFFKVIKDVESFIRKRQVISRNNPRVTIQCVISRQNEHEIGSLENLARNIGADEIVFKTMEITPGVDSTDYLPRNPKFRRYQISPDQWVRENDQKHCSELWHQPVMNSDGSFSVCCFDKTAELNPGTYSKGKFTDLWHGTEWMKIRENVKKNKAGILPCKKCTASLNLNYRSVIFR